MLIRHQYTVWHANGTPRVLTARSCGFFRPGNTILVPGMYFFGACTACDTSHDTPGPAIALAAQHGAQRAHMPPQRRHAETVARPTHQQVVIERVLCPVHGLLLVGLRVREALHRACRWLCHVSAPGHWKHVGLHAAIENRQYARSLFAVRGRVLVACCVQRSRGQC